MAEPARTAELVPDLLHPDPRDAVDPARTRQSIAFAFASGVSGGLFYEALAAAPLAPSTWDRGGFAADLFLDTLCDSTFKPTVSAGEEAPADAASARGHLVRLLAHPPSDRNIVLYRQEIARELYSSRALRDKLDALYLLLARLRDLLEGATGSGKWDPLRRQLDLLGVAKEIFDAMAGFEGARSGLSRLRAFGERVRAGEPYRSLANLLRYDEALATVDVKLGVGADGRIRSFRVVAAHEHDDNPFVLSPLRRWLARFELFARGYRFGEGEVMARLVDAVFGGIEEDVTRLVQVFGDVHFYEAAMGFCDRAASVGLAVCLPAFVPASDPRAYVGLFNPLLLPLTQPAAPVPCDVATDRHARTVLVTGPNSGGKTRLLQALGLCQVLAQAGLFVCAAEARVAPVPALVVSLSQETTAEQAEGRLGMELLRIRSLFERLPRGAMVLLDELCSGTNPSEGEEIFELVVRMLTRLLPQAFVTTHFLAFAKHLEQAKAIDDLRFLQVELGPDQAPTYRFVPGVATTSLAAQAALRLGVTEDLLRALIEHNAGPAEAAS
jgi:DNA mismatch repair protein MutS2